MRFDWWTLALQTVNVLILIWILARFFFRPIAHIIAKRQDEMNKLFADAEAARKHAADARIEAEKARTDLGAERSGTNCSPKRRNRRRRKRPSSCNRPRRMPPSSVANPKR